MRCALRGLPFLACAAALMAQQPQANSTSQPAGLETTWDTAAVLQDIGAHAGRLIPALDQVNAKVWTEKGASETYAAQLQSSKEQVKALADGAKALARNPEKLSAGLELLFRMRALDVMLASVVEAMRKYQSPVDAQALAGLAAENGANEERFERYLVNLAAQREQEFAVMDKEAQRCRGLVTQAPPRQSGRKK
jgi:hypothetical protein